MYVTACCIQVYSSAEATYNTDTMLGNPMGTW